MKKYLIITLALIMGMLHLHAQTPTHSKNYVMTTTVKVAGRTDSAKLIGMTPWEGTKTIEYFDGLGRPLQSVQWKASPQFRDLVQHHIYDPMGREAKKLLPYADSDSTGAYKADALVSQASFYNPSASWNVDIAKTLYPYAKTRFEFSPLSRVMEQGAPGSAWQPAATRALTGRTITMDYGANTVIDAVKKWVIGANGASAGGNYPAGKLSRTLTRDENWVSGKNGGREEFTDTEGKLVLKRIWKSETEALNTYYVYDNIGNLRYVIPPAVTANIIDHADANFNNYVYAYLYDTKNRLSKKHIPGMGWQYLVYNRLDQLVLSQDNKLRTQGKWLFNKYDALGRTIATGLIARDSTAVQWQQWFDTLPTNIKLYEQRLGSESELGYTNQVAPLITVSDCMQINYYDNYQVQGITTNYQSSVATASNNVKGLLLATKTRIIGGPLLLQVNYYDQEGKLVETIADNHLQAGKDRIVNTYAFSGELLNTSRTHIKSTDSLSIAKVYTYDHQGRKILSKQNIAHNGGVVLSKMEYNELGQLSAKSLHGGEKGERFAQRTLYTYNERGWLKSSNSPQFSMKLGYNSSDAFAQYNGNISSQTWGADSSKKFNYSYDPLDRLINATSTGIAMSEAITYDAMGNITTLNRDGILGTYAYIGNQLTSISGGTLTTGTYEYDVNGNVTKDGRNGMTLLYNHLNLPLSAKGNGKTLTYTYDANGRKLKSVVDDTISTTTRDYIDGIHYTNGNIEFIQTEEGRALRTGSQYSYQYNLTDHLGNVRYSFDIYNDTAQRLQSDDYYAFGLRKSVSPVALDNKYLYNGKELQEDLGQYDYGARFYDPVIGRWNVVDPLAEMMRRHSPYNYTFNNPLRFVDPDGMGPTSTHTDEEGNVIAIYEDGDLGVYKHKNGTSQDDITSSRKSKGNTAGGGEYVGETWTELGFADFGYYEENGAASDGSVKVGRGARIDFDSNWSFYEVRDILASKPSAYDYFKKAGGGGDWDIKSHVPKGETVYFGSKLYGKYASARDAGNFAAGAVAQSSSLPNFAFDYGFGLYNMSGNNKIKMAGLGLLNLRMGPLFGGAAALYVSKYGEDKLTRDGIEAGKRFIKGGR